MRDDVRGGPPRASRPSSSARSVAIVVLVILGAALRAAPIANRPLSLDEALTWRAAAKPWSSFVAWSHHPDHPPLSFALVRLSTTVTGSQAE